MRLDGEPCRRAREWLALGTESDVWIAEHLAGCASCRELADEIDRVSGALAATREITPPPELDRRLRSMLASPIPVVGDTFLRPVLATGVAIASLVSLVWFVASSLAGAGAAELAPVIAVFVAWIYLALSAAVTLPLLLLNRVRLRPNAEELQP